MGYSPVTPLTSCPACGYPLGFQPWRGESPSDRICPSCGIQFGYDDIAETGGLGQTKEQAWEVWRERWIEGGMQWFSRGRKPPTGWDPELQLKTMLRQLEMDK
jgi:hypothetical protein